MERMAQGGFQRCGPCAIQGTVSKLMSPDEMNQHVQQVHPDWMPRKIENLFLRRVIHEMATAGRKDAFWKGWQSGVFVSAVVSLAIWWAHYKGWL
jgi:hypothetical protein